MKKNLLPIELIAAKLDLPAESAQDPDHAPSLYEKHSPVSAKLNLAPLVDPRFNRRGKLILVTATTPTVSGEGKTVTSIGLGGGVSQQLLTWLAKGR